MAYRLQSGEPVSTGARRIVIELIDRAVAGLGDSGADRAREVHEARKRFKEIRAVLRLVRSEVDAYYPFENLFYRDSGRALSAARDSQAVIESLDKLEARFSGEFGEADVRAIRRRLVRRAKRADVEGRVPEVLSRLQEARTRVSMWPMKRTGFSAIEEGLGLVYSHGRRCFLLSYRNPTPENFHEWRKRAKDHWYHSQLLQDIWPEMMKSYVGTMKTLSQLLGDDHDLVMLRQILIDGVKAFGGDMSVFRMTQLIDRRRAELESEARVIGTRIYGEKPGKWIQRMRGYWESSALIV